MKIAWLTNNINQFGGVEQVICGLSSYFSGKLKHEVEIISLNSHSGGVFYPLDEAVQIRHCGLDWRNQTFRRLLTLVSNVMGRVDADILLTCHPTISYAAVLNKNKFRGRVVVTQHSACDSFSKKRLYCNAALFRLADQFVVLTEDDRSVYQKLGCSSIVIPNANFMPTNTRSSLEQKMILAAGRMEAVKGFDRLIAAFSLVAKRHPGWKLCICGGGSLENHLKTQVETLGLHEKVIFPGSVKNIHDYYMKASVFALPSHSEGFSLVLVEAMAAGIPVVSFNLPAAVEILDNGGGLLVPQGDICAFSEKLELLMSDEDLRKELGAKAYVSSEKYDISAIAERWMQLFHDITAR